MTTLDNEIEMLEKRLAELKKAKNIEQLSKKKNNFKIIIYKENQDIDDIYKEFETFDELKTYWETSCKLKNTDKISLDFFRNKKYENYEASIKDEKINDDEFEELIKIISTLDSWHLLTMEFAICNKKDVLRAMAFIKSEKLNDFGKLYDTGFANLKFQISEEEYWKKINEGKSFRLFE